MKITLEKPRQRDTQGRITVQRTEEDGPVKDWRGDSLDHRLLRDLGKFLNFLGFDLLRRNMAKDGHLVSDSAYYLKAKEKSQGPQVYVFDEAYAVRSMGEAYNEGQAVQLTVCFDIYGTQKDCAKKFAGLAGTYATGKGEVKRVRSKDKTSPAKAGTDPRSRAGRQEPGGPAQAPALEPGAEYPIGRVRRVVRTDSQRTRAK